jgi:hypothetical protein
VRRRIPAKIRNLPIWIPSIADVTRAIGTVATLIVLRRYTADSKTIAKNSSDEIECSPMPLVTLVLKGTGWAMKNQGFGPPVNIFYTRFAGDEKKP